MYPERTTLDLAIHVDGSPTPSTTHVTAVGPWALCVVIETSMPDVRALRLVSSYLGSPGDASASTHHLCAEGLPRTTSRRTFVRPPADRDACLRDHVSQLRDRLEELGVSPRFGCLRESALSRLW